MQMNHICALDDRPTMESCLQQGAKGKKGDEPIRRDVYRYQKRLYCAASSRLSLFTNAYMVVRRECALTDVV